jgi:cation/acetate symporter
MSVALTIVSPAVWEASLGHPKGSAMFPYASPAIFSMTAAFLVIWIVSLLDKSTQAAKERALFPAQLVRSETGVGSSSASGH